MRIDGQTCLYARKQRGVDRLGPEVDSLRSICEAQNRSSAPQQNDQATSKTGVGEFEFYNGLKYEAAVDRHLAADVSTGRLGHLFSKFFATPDGAEPPPFREGFSDS